MKTKTLSNGQEIWVSTFTGEVLSQHESQTVTVHQTESTVLSKDFVIPGQVYSKTHRDHKIWLRSAEGKEQEFNVGDIGLPVREGHQVTVAWGATQELETGWYIGARNHTTGEIRHDVLNAVGERLKTWKLKVGAGASYWRWTLGGTALAAVIGAVFGNGSRYRGPTMDDLILAGFGWGVAAFIAVSLLWLFIISNIVLNKPVLKLLAEVDATVRDELMAASKAVSAGTKVTS